MDNYDDLTDRTADLLALSDVKRWGVIKTMRDQSVAEHSFNVAVLTIELAARLNITDTDRLLYWALVHDAPETLTGDIDGKFKRENTDVRMAIDAAEVRYFPWYAKDKVSTIDSPLIYWLVKIADRVEALSWINMWGVGARADDVYRENIALLFDQMLPLVANVCQLDGQVLLLAVRTMLHYSTSETNGVQLRRFRREAATTGDAATVHEP